MITSIIRASKDIFRIILESAFSITSYKSTDIEVVERTYQECMTKVLAVLDFLNITTPKS